MDSDPVQIESHLAALSDDELLKVLEDTGTGYTQTARDIAGREADRWGGIEQIRRRVVDQEAARQARAREDVPRLAETRRYYTFPEHLFQTARRWILAYGGLALLWAVYRSRQDNVALALGIGVLASLFAVQAVVWSAVTYRRAPAHRKVHFCTGCKKAMILDRTVIQEAMAGGGTYSELCPYCGIVQTYDGETLGVLADERVL